MAEMALDMQAALAAFDRVWGSALDIRFEARGTINVKGKGDMHTYFLLGRK